MIGQRFGRFVIISLAGSNGKRKIYNCLCDCGAIKARPISDLKRGHTKSCGCFSRESIIKRNTTHGKTGTPLWVVWMGMKQRCYDVRAIRYKNYGGRGVTVCERWLDDFENFRADMVEIPFTGAQLDRIDNNKGYSPDNCRWATTKENARNKTTSRFIEFEGQVKTMAEWSEIKGISTSLLHARLGRLKWSVEKAISTKVRS